MRQEGELCQPFYVFIIFSSIVTKSLISDNLTFPPGEMIVLSSSQPVMESIMALLRHIHPREDEYVRYG